MRFRPDQSLADAHAELTRLLVEAGIDAPQRDARFLLQGLLKIGGALLISGGTRLLGADAARVEDAARRRMAHEPVSRILGQRAFYGREFIVTPDVLDPRPDTEAVVELAMDLLKARGLLERPFSIADIGTGSGVLMVTLLAELPQAQGVATDLSEAALSVARRNAEIHGVTDRVRFVATSSLEGCQGPFDLVVSNPPYISTEEIGGLERAVRDYDPLLALDGGGDGLDVYRKIARDSASLIRPLLVVLEVGATQAGQVERLFTDVGARPVGQRKDLGGHIRAVALEIHP